MFTDRREAIRAFIGSTGDDAFLLTAREDVRWACGFSGSNGALLITKDDVALFTDGRYADQAAEETDSVAIHVWSGDLLAFVGDRVGRMSLSSVAIDGSGTTIAAFHKLESWPGEPSIHPFNEPFALLIAVKDEEEIRRLKRAQKISDAVYAEILNVARSGMTERELAAEIVYRHLKHGAEKMSFDPIVASGRNGALPHASPTNRRLADGDMVVLDFGCFVDGYASDMTRTIAIGTPEPEALRTHATIRQAQAAAQQAARSGMRACDLDRTARALINEAGLGGAFTHSLGHGIGLRIHEAPRIAATNEGLLPDGAVVTIEPGVYISGRFGVRIENSVILHPAGCEPLPESSTELIIL